VGSSTTSVMSEMIEASLGGRVSFVLVPLDDMTHT
jgi:hypothetical protein